MLLVINLGKLDKSVMAKESGIAKSIGDQKEQDIQFADTILINFLLTGKKKSKIEAGYRERHQKQGNRGSAKQQESCDKCKFNLPAEQLCHIVEGQVSNKEGISKFFPPGDTECCQAIFFGIMLTKRVKN
jgi:hypothetical protein